MRFMKPLSPRGLLAYRLALTLTAGLALAPWALVTAQAPAPEKIEKKASPQQKEKVERGRFLSFQNGTLTIHTNAGNKVATPIPATAKILVWNDADNAYKPATSLQTLDRLEAGTWCMVSTSADNVALRVGSRKGVTVGTFVSFKDQRLLILGKNLGESFVKKYGNNVHFNRFRPDVPAYESIDGGDYKLVGLANQVLPNIKEGTVLSIHGEGDDNITRLDIGVPNKK